MVINFKMATESSKELNPGILLHKTVIKHPKGDEFERTFEYSVELQRLQTLEFTVDFTDSSNVVLESAQGLVKTTVVEAFSTVAVATLRMKKKWTLKSKFRFTIRAASKQMQERYLKSEFDRI